MTDPREVLRYLQEKYEEERAARTTCDPDLRDEAVAHLSERDERLAKLLNRLEKAGADADRLWQHGPGQQDGSDTALGSIAAELRARRYFDTYVLACRSYGMEPGRYVP